MTKAVAFVRKSQHEAAVASRIAHAKMVVLRLTLERKSKEAQGSVNRMEEAVGAMEGLQNQVTSLTLRAQSLESLLRVRELELEDARRAHVSLGGALQAPRCVSTPPRSFL